MNTTLPRYHTVQLFNCIVIYYIPWLLQYHGTILLCSYMFVSPMFVSPTTNLWRIRLPIKELGFSKQLVCKSLKISLRHRCFLAQLLPQSNFCLNTSFLILICIFNSESFLLFFLFKAILSASISSKIWCLPPLCLCSIISIFVQHSPLAFAEQQDPAIYFAVSLEATARCQFFFT